MKAFAYHGLGRTAWKDVPDPVIIDGTDAIVRVEATTICGTDLHILNGDLPSVTDGRILGHEAVGTVVAVGDAVSPRTHRRPGVGVVRHLVRHMPLLPRGPRSASAWAAAGGSWATPSTAPRPSWCGCPSWTCPPTPSPTA